MRRLLGDLTDFPPFLGVCWRGLDGEPHEGVAPLMFLSNADWVNIFMEIIMLRQFVQHRNNTLPLHMQVKHSFTLVVIILVLPCTESSKNHDWMGLTIFVIQYKSYGS